MIENGVIFFAKASQTVHGFAGLGYAGLRRDRRESRPRFGGLMSFCGVSELDCSSLTRLLQTAGLSLALMTASAAGVYAESVTIQGAPGANGADGVNPGDSSQPGGDGESVTANAGSGITSPLNKATAIGGLGGAGGSGPGAPGGKGGDAGATATTNIVSGLAEADAISVGGMGGGGGGQSPTGNSGQNAAMGGTGGSATAGALASSGTGKATATASATGGSGSSTFGQGPDSPGGNASASSTALTTGSGDALSSANATGGTVGDGGAGIFALAGSATATANAFAAGGGKAIAKAFAQGASADSSSPPFPVANATSNAATAQGAMAQALSTTAFENELQSTALQSTAATSFEGMSVQSNAVDMSGFDTAAEAIAQGGSSQTFAPPGGFFGNTVFAAATALPDKAYATTLIGGASDVADALLGPRDKIFGTAIVDSVGGFAVGVPSEISAGSTFDFRFQGDLLLGVIDTFGSVNITINGTEMVFDTSNDTVINLGNFGPDIDLTTAGLGTFAFGGAVPEPSTWAMMLLGFAGLGFVGYRSAGCRRSSRKFST
jgi:hypothetical protein